MRKLAINSNHIYDAVIIGGGITGAGIFYEAGKNGYDCILLEKNDFAGGTSSRSAKLVHGGLRYLKSGKINLVREGLRERHFLLESFPHLVKPLQFLLPIYSSRIAYAAGMWLYKQFSHDKALSDYTFLNKTETINHFPSINTTGLKGSYLYYDAVTNDARLTNEIIRRATEDFCIPAMNYCEFQSARDCGQHFVISCFDQIEKKSIPINAKYIINAGGPWVDHILHRYSGKKFSYTAPSKGVHIVFSREKLPASAAIAFSSYANDGRMLYAIPWENNTVLVGATDTDYVDDPDKCTVANTDVTYLLHALNQFAPSLNLSSNDILFSFAGLRPLIKEDKSSKDRTRDYRVWWEYPRVLSILGGKLTSFHAMALTAISKLNELPAKPINREIPVQKRSDPALSVDIPEPFKAKINANYGGEASKIFSVFSEKKYSRSILENHFSTHPAEAIYFIRYQHAFHLDDLLTRRLSLTYVIKNHDKQKELIRELAGIMGAELGWDEKQKDEEIRMYESTHGFSK